MSEELIALAERCERAEGPDAEFPGKLLVAAYDLIWPDFKDGPQGFFSMVAHGGYIDAAMSLVPKGWRVARMAEWIGSTMREKGEWQAALTCLTPCRRRIEIEHAATPALALCAAALRARASTEPTP